MKVESWSDADRPSTNVTLCRICMVFSLVGVNLMYHAHFIHYTPLIVVQAFNLMITIKGNLIVELYFKNSNTLPVVNQSTGRFGV